MTSNNLDTIAQAAIWEKRTGKNGKDGLFALTTPPDLSQERVILLLPGSGNINIPSHRTARMMSGALNYLYQPEYRHLCLAYSSETEFVHHYHAYDIENHHSWSPDIQMVMDHVFAGNIPDMRDCPESDRPERLIECAQHFGNIKIFGHCYGAMAATQLNSALNAEMDRLGYDATEKNDLIPEICSFTVAGITRPGIELGRQIPGFTSIDMVAFNDRRLRDNFDLFSYFEQSVEDSLSFRNNTAIVELRDNHLAIYSRHPKEKIAEETRDHPRSHFLSTYLSIAEGVVPEKDRMPFLFTHLWSGMCRAQSDIPGFMRDQVIEYAQEHPSFADFWANTKILTGDDLLSLRLLQHQSQDDDTPYASSLSQPFDHTKLAQEQTEWPDPYALHLVLGLSFRAIGRDFCAAPLPDDWQKHTNTTKIAEAIDLLLPPEDAPDNKPMTSRALLDQPNHASHNGRIVENHLIINENLYHRLLFPIQQAWANNPEQQMLTSIIHDATETASEQDRQLCQLSTFRQKRLLHEKKQAQAKQIRL